MAAIGTSATWSFSERWSALQPFADMIRRYSRLLSAKTPFCTELAQSVKDTDFILSHGRACLTSAVGAKCQCSALSHLEYSLGEGSRYMKFAVIKLPNLISHRHLCCLTLFGVCS